MDLLFSCLSRYQEIITVYILLLDPLLVHCSRSRDNKLNIQREILYQSAPKCYCLFIEWVQNSRVCHTASIQNPLKSYHIQRISMHDCGAIAQWSLQPYNHRLLTTKKVVDECEVIKLVDKHSRKLHIWADMHGQLRWEPITAEAIKNLFSVFTYSHLNTRWGWENLRKLRELDTQSRVCITLNKFPNLEYLTEKT